MHKTKDLAITLQLEISGDLRYTYLCKKRKFKRKVLTCTYNVLLRLHNGCVPRNCCFRFCLGISLVPVLSYSLLLSHVSGLVQNSARNPDVLAKNAFNTVNFHLMGNLLMDRGICKSRCTCAGSNGIAKVIADTIACLRGRKKEKNLVINQSSIMGNGRFNVFMESRFSLIFQ